MSSPKVPEKITENLTFIDALSEIMAGKSITKKEWNDRKVYGILQHGRLTLHRDDIDHDWILTDGDLFGDDFYVL